MNQTNEYNSKTLRSIFMCILHGLTVLIVYCLLKMTGFIDMRLWVILFNVLFIMWLANLLLTIVIILIRGVVYLLYKV